VGTSIVLLSKEGVTQGVPSAMKLYSIGLLITINPEIKGFLRICQNQMEKTRQGNTETIGTN